MSGAQIDDAAAAKEPPHPARHLPRLVQLFARQTSGMANGARHAMEERVVREIDRGPDPSAAHEMMVRTWVQQYTRGPIAVVWFSPTSPSN